MRSIIMSTILVTAAAAYVPSSAAQERRIALPTMQNLSEMRLSPVQLKQVETLTRAEDAKIERALRGNPVLRIRLTREVERIAQIKDGAAQRQAIAAFQAANGAAYRGLLSQAGVNLQSLAQRLGAVSPDLKFEVQGGTHLVKAQSASAASTGPAPAPAGGTTRVVNVRLSDFAFDAERNCGLAAGSSATFNRPMLLKVEGWSAVAGGCQNSGRATYRFDLRPNEVAEVELRGSLSAEGVAVGLGAVAQSSNSATVTLRGTSATDQRYKSVNCFTVAPFAWVGSCEDTANNFVLRSTVTKAEDAQISISGYVLVNASVSPYTNATSIADIRSIRITYYTK